MQVSEKQKESIINIIFSMKNGEAQWMKDYLPEERAYIRHLMEYQSGRNGWIIESNGTAEDINTITKFRKRIARF